MSWGGSTGSALRQGWGTRTGGGSRFQGNLALEDRWLLKYPGSRVKLLGDFPNKVAELYPRGFRTRSGVLDSWVLSTGVLGDHGTYLSWKGEEVCIHHTNHLGFGLGWFKMAPAPGQN